MTTYASDGSVMTDTPPLSEPLDTTVVEEPALAPDDVVEPEIVEPATEPALAPEGPADGEVVHDAELVVLDEAATTEGGAWVHQSPWEHDWLTYKGDKLAVRIPQQNQLTALFQAGKCSPEFQMKLTDLFVKRHISQESIERVLERAADPDDAEYASGGGWDDLLKTIAEIGGKRALKDAEALAAAQAGKGKS